MSNAPFHRYVMFCFAARGLSIKVKQTPSPDPVSIAIMRVVRGSLHFNRHAPVVGLSFFPAFARTWNSSDLQTVGINGNGKYHVKNHWTHVKNNRKHLLHNWFHSQSDLQFAQRSSLLFLGHKLGQFPLLFNLRSRAHFWPNSVMNFGKVMQRNTRHVSCTYLFYICIWTVPIASYLYGFVRLFMSCFFWAATTLRSAISSLNTFCCEFQTGATLNWQTSAPQTNPIEKWVLHAWPNAPWGKTLKCEIWNINFGVQCFLLVMWTSLFCRI